jgi:hypothetical protein
MPDAFEGCIGIQVFMSHILLSIFLNCLVPVLATAQDSSVEMSASRKLTWNDFRAAPPKKDPAAALSSTEIKIDWDIMERHLNIISTAGLIKNRYELE